MFKNSAVSSPRGAVIIGLLSLPVVVIAVTAIVWWVRLPQRVATHSDDQGHIDGYTPLWELLVGCLVVALLAGAVAVVFLGDSRDPAQAAIPTILAGAFSGTACSAWIALAGASLSPSAPLTGSSGAIAVVGLLYAGPLWAAVGRASTPAREEPPATHREEDGESAYWIASITTPAMAAVGMGIVLVPGAVIWSSAHGSNTPAAVTFISLAVCALLGAFTASLSSLRVVVDSRGLVIRSRITGLIVSRIRLDDISDVSADVVTPAQWGGWGYRILPGRRALVLHSGSGMVITKRNGRQFAFTVNSPNRGAELLRRLVVSQGHS